MRFVLASLALLMLSGAAFAQSTLPTCYPSEGACSPAITQHYPASATTPPGMCRKWWVLVADQWKPDGGYGFCVEYEDFQPDDDGTIADLLTKTLSKNARDSLWKKQVVRHARPLELVTWNAMNANKPRTPFAVPGNLGAERSLYKVSAAGKRSTTASGKVSVGTSCYPSVWHSGDYAAITLTPPTMAALCARR